jgi:hypothetical protein
MSEKDSNNPNIPKQYANRKSAAKGRVTVNMKMHRLYYLVDEFHQGVTKSSIS